MCHILFVIYKITSPIYSALPSDKVDNHSVNFLTVVKAVEPEPTESMLLNIIKLDFIKIFEYRIFFNSLEIVCARTFFIFCHFAPISSSYFFLTGRDFKGKCFDKL